LITSFNDLPYQGFSSWFCIPNRIGFLCARSVKMSLYPYGLKTPTTLLFLLLSLLLFHHHVNELLHHC